MRACEAGAGSEQREGGRDRAGAGAGPPGLWQVILPLRTWASLLSGAGRGLSGSSVDGARLPWGWTRWTLASRLQSGSCARTRPGRCRLQWGRAGHPALPPGCFILATDCTNPRANIELAWILNSSCKHRCSQLLALCSLPEEGIQVPLAPGSAWANTTEGKQGRVSSPRNQNPNHLTCP